jgi:F-type H+-transporting ATPase subunit delta
VAASSSIKEIAGRYATALFELAEDAKALDSVADDLRQIQAGLDESDDLAAVLRSPVMSRDDQGKAMSAVLDKMGTSDLTKKFVGYVAANRRLFAMEAMITAYLEALAESRGEVTAEVVSAKSMTKTRLSAIEKAIKAAVGGKVSINHSVNPDLVGGLTVKVGSRMIDASVSTQLSKLKLAMKGA